MSINDMVALLDKLELPVENRITISPENFHDSQDYGTVSAMRAFASCSGRERTRLADMMSEEQRKGLLVKLLFKNFFTTEMPFDLDILSHIRTGTSLLEKLILSSYESPIGTPVERPEWVITIEKPEMEKEIENGNHPDQMKPFHNRSVKSVPSHKIFPVPGVGVPDGPKHIYVFLRRYDLDRILGYTRRTGVGGELARPSSFLYIPDILYRMSDAGRNIPGVTYSEEYGNGQMIPNPYDITTRRIMAFPTIKMNQTIENDSPAATSDIAYRKPDSYDPAGTFRLQRILAWTANPLEAIEYCMDQYLGSVWDFFSDVMITGVPIKSLLAASNRACYQILRKRFSKAMEEKTPLERIRTLATQQMRQNSYDLSIKDFTQYFKKFSDADSMMDDVVESARHFGFKLNDSNGNGDGSTEIIRKRLMEFVPIWVNRYDRKNTKFVSGKYCNFRIGGNDFRQDVLERPDVVFNGGFIRVERSMISQEFLDASISARTMINAFYPEISDGSSGKIHPGDAKYYQSGLNFFAPDFFETPKKPVSDVWMLNRFKDSDVFAVDQGIYNQRISELIRMNDIFEKFISALYEVEEKSNGGVIAPGDGASSNGVKNNTTQDEQIADLVTQCAKTLVSAIPEISQYM